MWITKNREQKLQPIKLWICYHIYTFGVCIMNASTLSEIASLWNRVLNELSKQINDSRIFDVFFKDTYIYSINGKEMIVACDSSLVTTILHDKYEDLVTQTVDSLTGTNFEVTFVNNSDLKNQTPTEIVADTHPKFFQNSEISPNFTFDNFVVGPSNKEASQASLLSLQLQVSFIILYLYIANPVLEKHIY
jgi:chromosomal replication initiation ATPase DnaA